MKNPGSPLALILDFFHQAAIIFGILLVVWAFGLFVIATIRAFVLPYVSAENAVLIGVIAACGILFLISRALPNPPSSKGDS